MSCLRHFTVPTIARECICVAGEGPYPTPLGHSMPCEAAYRDQFFKTVAATKQAALHHTIAAEAARN